MHHYSQGESTKQAHKAIPEGYFEEEQGRKGFFGPVSHLIRKNPSTRWKEIQGDLLPRLYDLVKLDATKPRVQRLFYNSDVTILKGYVPKYNKEELLSYRNADGDMMLFCHKGSGKVLTEYGELDFRRGTYIIIPKNIAYTILANEDCDFFMTEAKGSGYEEPARGIVGRHAVYDINAIGKPDLAKQEKTLATLWMPVTKVEIKYNEEKSTYVYPDNFYDVIGWKGDLFPFTLHMDDMMPLMSHRAHLPPSAHTTFVAQGFVICTFLPRPLESDADALKVPFYHQNMDYDEILFYHDGDFFSRDNLHAGMLTYHPAGFPHGPHPKAMEKVKTQTHTKEYAVMVDTRQPLKRDASLEALEVKDYWKSWQKK